MNEDKDRPRRTVFMGVFPVVLRRDMVRLGKRPEPLLTGRALFALAIVAAMLVMLLVLFEGGV